MELTIEKIQEYRKVEDLLDEVCEKIFLRHMHLIWKYYGGLEVFQIITLIVLLFWYGYYDLEGPITRAEMRLFQWMFW